MTKKEIEEKYPGIEFVNAVSNTHIKGFLNGKQIIDITPELKTFYDFEVKEI